MGTTNYIKTNWPLHFEIIIRQQYNNTFFLTSSSVHVDLSWLNCILTSQKTHITLYIYFFELVASSF